MPRKDKAMGPSRFERIKDDFYPTPAWCTKGLLEQVPFWSRSNIIWEPAAGKGDISRVLSDEGYSVVSSDLVCYESHYRPFIRTGVDFLKQEQMYAGSRHIVTNPPYKLAEEFINHAIALATPVKGKVIMLLRNEYDCAKKRNYLFSTKTGFEAKYVLTSRPRWIEGSTGSPRHNYAWFVWNTKLIGTGVEPVLRYINRS